MKISDSVLKYHLKNVLWIGGGACGGKTTVADLLGTKHGLAVYHCDDKSPEHHLTANQVDHPAMKQRITSWDWFFNRPEEEYVQWLHQNSTEQMEMIVVDLLKLSYDHKIIVEGVFNAHILREIASPSQVVFLHAEPALIHSQYFERNHTHELLKFAARLSDPQGAVTNALNAVVQASLDNMDSALQCGFTCFLRESSTSLDESTQLVENYFKLNQGDAG